MAADEEHPPTTVVIADDNELLVDALRLAIAATPGLDVVGTAGDGPEALAVVRAHGPDVVLMDLRLGGQWGLDLVPDLRADAEAPEVVVFSAADLDGLADEAARAGVFRQVPKGAPLTEVVQAIVDAGRSRRATTSQP